MAKLNEWCKLARCEMIQKDLRVDDVASGTGMSRPYVSSILNGRVTSEPGVKRISSFLGIPDTVEPLRQ